MTENETNRTDSQNDDCGESISDQALGGSELKAILRVRKHNNDGKSLFLRCNTRDSKQLE